jgi:hypothetical protein
MVTVKVLVAIPLLASGLVTITSHGPPAASDRSSVPVIMVELTTVGEAKLMLVMPLSMRAVAPGWKNCPHRLRMATLLLVSPESGVIPSTNGADGMFVGVGMLVEVGRGVAVGFGGLGVLVGDGTGVSVGVGGGCVGVGSVGVSVGNGTAVAVGAGGLGVSVGAGARGVSAGTGV